MGHGIGMRFLELCLAREKSGKREVKLVNLLQYISTSMWKTLFGKKADGVEKSKEHDNVCTWALRAGNPMASQASVLHCSVCGWSDAMRAWCMRVCGCRHDQGQRSPHQPLHLRSTGLLAPELRRIHWRYCEGRPGRSRLCECPVPLVCRCSVAALTAPIPPVQTCSVTTHSVANGDVEQSVFVIEFAAECLNRDV